MQTKSKEEVNERRVFTVQRPRRLGALIMVVLRTPEINDKQDARINADSFLSTDEFESMYLRQNVKRNILRGIVCSFFVPE